MMEEITYNDICNDKLSVRYRMHDYKKSAYLLENFRLFYRRSRGLNTAIDYHYHEFCKLLIFHSGSGSYVVDNQRYHLQSGDMVFIDRNQVHKPEIDPDCVYERTIVYIEHKFLKEESNGVCDLSTCFGGEKGHILRLDQQKYQKVCSITSTLSSELSQKNFGREIIAKALLLELLVNVCRYQQETGLHPSPIQPKNDRILSILRYMDDHLCEDIEINQLADRFFISKYHLMRLFNKETGSTIHSYLVQRRLLLARELIKQGVCATDACYRSGFRSYSAFTRAYSKNFGTTPTGRKDPRIAMSPTYE